MAVNKKVWVYFLWNNKTILQNYWFKPHVRLWKMIRIVLTSIIYPSSCDFYIYNTYKHLNLVLHKLLLPS